MIFWLQHLTFDCILKINTYIDWKQKKPYNFAWNSQFIQTKSNTYCFESAFNVCLTFASESEVCTWSGMTSDSSWQKQYNQSIASVLPDYDSYDSVSTILTFFYTLKMKKENMEEKPPTQSGIILCQNCNVFDVSTFLNHLRYTLDFCFWVFTIFKIASTRNVPTRIYCSFMELFFLVVPLDIWSKFVSLHIIIVNTFVHAILYFIHIIDMEETWKQ